MGGSEQAQESDAGVDKVGRGLSSRGCAIPAPSPAAALAPLSPADGIVQWGLLPLSDKPHETDASFLKPAVVEAALGGQERVGGKFASFTG